MPNRAANHRIAWLLLAIVLVGGWMAWPRQQAHPPPAQASQEATHAPSDDRRPEPLHRVEPSQPESAADAGTRVQPAGLLPIEASDTIARILRGGPFPHRQDGSVFGNREGHLPRKPRGWYREYTVDTPGLSHRGARRIVTGGDPPREWYYSDDHYDSFRAFDPGARSGALR